MSHLTPDQLADFRAEIERQLARLEKSMAENLAERERARFAQLRGALERIDAGTYGVCEDCAGAIPPGRLFVVPETITCGACG